MSAHRHATSSIYLFTLGVMRDGCHVGVLLILQKVIGESQLQRAMATPHNASKRNSPRQRHGLVTARALDGPRRRGLSRVDSFGL